MKGNIYLKSGCYLSEFKIIDDKYMNFYRFLFYKQGSKYQTDSIRLII